MPTFKEYKADGRELMVRFTCQRCKDYVVEPLTENKIANDSYGWLHAIKKPEGWAELPYNQLLCPKCYKAYQDFMHNKRTEGRP